MIKVQSTPLSIKVFISDCYVTDDILYALNKPTLSSSRLGKSFTPLFLQQRSSYPLQCILQLWNCFAWCLWLLQAAKMWVDIDITMTISVKMLICIFVIMQVFKIQQQYLKSDTVKTTVVVKHGLPVD